MLGATVPLTCRPLPHRLTLKTLKTLRPSRRLRALSSVPSRALDLAAWRTSRFGERRGIDWLTYNPLQLRVYHKMALLDAPAVVSGLTETFPRASRFVDVGAGSGAYAAEILRRGRYVEACEFALSGRFYAWLQGVHSRPLDLRCQPPANLRGNFDLAYCFEVAEHCTPEHGERLVEFIASLAPVVVFTAAQPGQGGLGHINEQEPGYWIEQFMRQGVEYRSDTTTTLRDAFASHGVKAPWLVNNLAVFMTRQAPD